MEMVSTLKKSAATRIFAWAARNGFQVNSDRRGAGGIPAPSSTDRIVVAATVCPSFNNSPRIRK